MAVPRAVEIAFGKSRSRKSQPGVAGETDLFGRRAELRFKVILE